MKRHKAFYEGVGSYRRQVCVNCGASRGVDYEHRWGRWYSRPDGKPQPYCSNTLPKENAHD